MKQTLGARSAHHPSCREVGTRYMFLSISYQAVEGEHAWWDKVVRLETVKVLLLISDHWRR
jgi:hypothetical protein